MSFAYRSMNTDTGTDRRRYLGRHQWWKIEEFTKFPRSVPVAIYETLQLCKRQWVPTSYMIVSIPREQIVSTIQHENLDAGRYSNLSVRQIVAAHDWYCGLFSGG
ncbi:hypothetical protein KC352_g12 [Hortaea werneckii]|nr:hypothetical protein KC352_g12 [Hortaea werneckii]